jgi:hypothetical protein
MKIFPFPFYHELLQKFRIQCILGNIWTTRTKSITYNTKSYENNWNIFGTYCTCCIFMGVPEGKNIGRRKEICPTFSDCACVVKFSGETFQNCCRRRGWSDYGKFLLDSIYSTKLTEFPSKLTEFVPFIFIIRQCCLTVKRILPDWLCFPHELLMRFNLKNYILNVISLLVYIIVSIEQGNQFNT